MEIYTPGKIYSKTEWTIVRVNQFVAGPTADYMVIAPGKEAEPMKENRIFTHEEAKKVLHEIRGIDKALARSFRKFIGTRVDDKMLAGIKRLRSESSTVWWNMDSLL